MGKLRLNCPNCGKPVAVSETAKKARCPGCKKVMDVAKALAGDLDPSTELSAKPETDAAGTEDSAAADDKPEAAGEGAEDGGKAAKPRRRSSRAARKSGRKSGKKSARAEAQEGDKAKEGDKAEKGDEGPKRDVPAAPTFDLPGGAQPWMIIVSVGVIAVILLWLVANVRPLAAIGIASALGLFVDSALMRITRVSPSAKGWGSMPMVWGLIGFVPIVGVVVYVLLRQKLVESSPEDIATPDMDEDDMSYEGKVRPPSVASVGVVLVLGLAILGGMFFQLAPSTWVKVGTGWSEKRKILTGQKENRMYDSYSLYAVFHARDPLADYGELTFEVLKLNNDGTSTPVDDGKVKANIGNDNPRRGKFQFEVKAPGKHRLLVKDSEDGRYATYDFRILKSGR